jgi:hypothetical protein
VAKYFTFFRHPEARIVSLFHYIRTDKNHHFNKKVLAMDFTEFVTSSICTENENVRMLCGSRSRNDDLRCSFDREHALAEAKRHLLEDFMFVGIQECINQGLEVLKALPRYKPLIIVVEDTEQIDAMSLELFDELAKQLGSLKLFLVMCWRNDSGLPAGSCLVDWADDEKEEVAGSHIHVAKMSKAEAEDMAQAIA